MNFLCGQVSFLLNARQVDAITSSMCSVFPLCQFSKFSLMICHVPVDYHANVPLHFNFCSALYCEALHFLSVSFTALCRIVSHLDLPQARSYCTTSEGKKRGENSSNSNFYYSLYKRPQTK